MGKEDEEEGGEREEKESLTGRTQITDKDKPPLQPSRLFFFIFEAGHLTALLNEK